MESLHPLPAPGPLSTHPVDVGQRTEAIILAELVKRGHRVLIPFGVNHRYDFVLDMGERFVRVQCKTARIQKGCVIFHCQSIRSNTKRTYTRDYRGEADLFLVFCRDNSRIYAVRVEEATRSAIHLRLEPTANHQAEGIRWAADYELPDPDASGT